MIIRLLKIAGLILILSVTTLAHDPGLSAAEIRILPDRIVAEVSFAPTDLGGVQDLRSNLLVIQNWPLRSFNLKSSDRNSIHFLLEFSSSNATGQLRISAPVLGLLHSNLRTRAES